MKTVLFCSCFYHHQYYIFVGVSGGACILSCLIPDLEIVKTTHYKSKILEKGGKFYFTI